MKKKITITNAYTWYNKGDAGILLATIDCLKKIYGEENVEFNILSFTPDEDKKRYCKDKSIKNVYSNILNPHPYHPSKIGKLIAIFKLILKVISLNIILKFNFKKAVRKNETLSLLNDTDIIVVCGGGFLGGKKYDSLMHVYQIYINTLFKKPIYIMGNSIEPINNKLIKYFTNKVINKVDFLFARETITYNYLKDVMSHDKFALIPDMAFMLTYEENEYEFLTNLRKDFDILFGITVRNWNFPNVSNKEKAKENYINSIVETVIEVIDNHHAAFIFIPQVTVHTGDDSLVAEEIRNRLPKKYKNNFIVRKDDWSPYEIKGLIKQLDYFVGTRMHSNIFATAVRIPTVAIAYEKKTNGIMETVKLNDYIVEIDSITSKELVDKIEKMIKNKDKIKSSLNKNIPIIQNNILTVLSDNMIKESDNVKINKK
ncbi:MAG: polysaccharide pyruvyl transferase family protein [bacterium]